MSMNVKEATSYLSLSVICYAVFTAFSPYMSFELYEVPKVIFAGVCMYQIIHIGLFIFEVSMRVMKDTQDEERKKHATLGVCSGAVILVMTFLLLGVAMNESIGTFLAMAIMYHYGATSYTRTRSEVKVLSLAKEFI